MKHQDPIKSILVTGNAGYIGSVLVQRLVALGYNVTGLDTFYYDDTCRLYSESATPHVQIRKDIREIDVDTIEGFDAIIHLAALSNDPLGEFDPAITEEINFHAAVSLAEKAKKSGVRRFILASSQSMYGIADSSSEVDEDTSEKHPLTAYARTKWDAECAITELNDESFTVVCFRPSTVFGSSPKLRCDIVFNNLVGCAYTTGAIEIKSDGTPWRPVVHVEDVASSFISGLTAPATSVGGEAFNVGIENGNFTVRNLAEAAQRSVPGSTLVFTGEHGPDSRTYRVSFSKIFKLLGNYYKPEWDIDRGGKELVAMFGRTEFTETQFRGQTCNRLPRLKYLVETGKLDQKLRWNTR